MVKGIVRNLGLTSADSIHSAGFSILDRNRTGRPDTTTATGTLSATAEVRSSCNPSVDAITVLMSSSSFALSSNYV